MANLFLNFSLKPKHRYVSNIISTYTMGHCGAVEVLETSKFL